MNEENKGCKNMAVSILLTILAIAMLLAVGTVAAPLDKLQIDHTIVVQP